MNYVHATSHTPRAAGQPAVNVVVRPCRDHSSENIVDEDCLVAPLYEDLNGYRYEAQAYNDAWRAPRGGPDGIAVTVPLTVPGIEQMIVRVPKKGYQGSKRRMMISNQAYTARSGILIPTQRGKMVIGRHAKEIVVAAVPFRRATGWECHSVVRTDMGKVYRKRYVLGISLSTLDCMNALTEAKQAEYEPMHLRLAGGLWREELRCSRSARGASALRRSQLSVTELGTSFHFHRDSPSDVRRLADEVLQKFLCIRSPPHQSNAPTTSRLRLHAGIGA